MDILSRLRLVDIDQIYFHEPVEPRRLQRTCQAIEKEGVIRHPVIATALSPDRYLILDGAHRTHSLQQLGCNKSLSNLWMLLKLKWKHGNTLYQKDFGWINYKTILSSNGPIQSGVNFMWLR